jgi:hypothetical protein
MNNVLLTIVIVVVLAQAANAGDADFERRVQENRRLFEQRAAEHRRQFEERTGRLRRGSEAMSTTHSYGSGTTNYGTQSSGSQSQLPVHKFQYANQSDHMKGTDFNPLAYDVKKAPSPDLCFLKFVATAKTATNMNQLMEFLPFSKSRTLKERQEQYDPQMAAQHRESFKRSDPNIGEASLTHLTQDPYSGELKHCREVAAKVLRIRKVTIKGNKAILDVGVRAEATQDGAKYPYGIADVEMICEGNYWKFSSYSDHNIFYKEPQ